VSQKELQRVAVISACIKGEVACASAAELLCLSVRQIKRTLHSHARRSTSSVVKCCVDTESVLGLPKKNYQ
jgi:hypothetical protein